MIGKLEFLSGSWDGEGLALHFGRPADGVLLGRLEAIENGSIVLEEDFRFSEEGTGIRLDVTRAGLSAGVYRVTHLRAAPAGVIADNPGIALRSRLECLLVDDASMVVAVEGARDGEGYRQEWLVRRQAEGSHPVDGGSDSETD